MTPNRKPLPQPELAAKAREGDENALKSLFDSVLPLALHHAKLHCRNDIDDCLQEMRLRLWQKLDKWNPKKGRFECWASTLFRNVALDYYRKNSRFPILLPDSPDLPDLFEKPDPSPLPDTVAIYHQQRDRLSALIEKIPNPNQRDALILRHLRGFSIKETAEALDCKENTAKVYVFRAKQSVRNAAARIA